MQKLITISKTFIFALLSLSLLLVWTGGNKEIVSFAPAIKTKSSNVVTSVEAIDSVWNSMSHELNLDHKEQSPQVKAEIRKLLADQNKLYNILKAAGPYIYFIHQQTQLRGLPSELALIPVIESEFNPNDHSTRGATGLWQLMSGTAHELGVKVKSGYDGRRNVIASTKAALAYFNDLGNDFDGNWYLAIAAYNCGQGRVKIAERHAGSQSFWKLHLPKETEYYVPRLLAVAEIVKDPEKYGVELPPINNQPYFTALKINKTLNLAQVAKSAGMNIKTLNTLNPDFNHNSLSQKTNNMLLVPIDKAPIIKASLGVA